MFLYIISEKYNDELKKPKVFYSEEDAKAYLEEELVKDIVINYKDDFKCDLFMNNEKIIEWAVNNKKLDKNKFVGKEYDRELKLSKQRVEVDDLPRALTKDEIDVFNRYLNDITTGRSNMHIALGNSDWCSIYSKIVGKYVAPFAEEYVKHWDNYVWESSYKNTV